MRPQLGVVLTSLLALSAQSAGFAAARSSAAQGLNWDSVKRLPDWSGVWVLSDESFQEISLVDCAGTPGHYQATVPVQAKYRDLCEATSRVDVTKGEGAPGNLIKGLPAGMPGILTHPIMFEFLFTPGRVTILFENCEIRRIHTDGRPHPPVDELDYGFSGNSVGHWAGATLVVDTIGISPRADMFLSNDIHATRQTIVSERLVRTDAGTLQIDTVVTDPEIFTKPYTYRRTYQRVTLPLTDVGCGPTNRDSDVAVDLTPPE